MISKEDMKSMILRIMRELKTPATEPTAKSPDSIAESLLKRLSTFKYDPESGLTFDLWYKRHENVLTTDGAGHDDAAKVRLIVHKLDQEDPIDLCRKTRLPTLQKPSTCTRSENETCDTHHVRSTDGRVQIVEQEDSQTALSHENPRPYGNRP